MGRGGRRFDDGLLGTLCACLAITALIGCERAAGSRDTKNVPPEARSAEERLARIWTLLGSDDPNSFREAVSELASLPREVYEAPAYAVEGPPRWDILRIGDATVRLDGEWMKAACRRFLEFLESSDPQEARQHYEALDVLLAGVMRSARNWTARQLGKVPPLAYHTALDLRTLLPRAMLESKKYADDAAFEQLLRDRRERLRQIGRKSFSQISDEVP